MHQKVPLRGLNSGGLVVGVNDGILLSNGWRRLNHTHVSREGGVRNPLGGCARGGFLEHTIDLFEGEAFGFGDEEVCVDEAGAAESSPDEEDARS